MNRTRNLSQSTCSRKLESRSEDRLSKGSNQIDELDSSRTRPFDENPESYPTFFIAMIESGKHANDLKDEKPFPEIIMFYNFRYPEFSTTIAPPNNFWEFTYT